MKKFLKFAPWVLLFMITAGWVAGQGPYTILQSAWLVESKGDFTGGVTDSDLTTNTCVQANSSHKLVTGTPGLPCFQPSINIFQQVALGSPVTLPLTGTTLVPVITLSPITMPSLGCPCRIRTGYSANWSSGNVTLVSSYVETSDGSNIYDTAGLQNQEANSAQPASNGTSGTTNGTYANGATVSVILYMEAIQTAATVNVAPKTAGPDTYLQAEVLTSN